MEILEKIKPAKPQGVVKGFDYVITGVIFLVFLLCPLFFTGLTSQGLGFEKMVLFYFLVLLGTVAWVSKGVIMGELEFKRTPLDWPIVGLLVVFIVSTVLSVSQKDSLIGSFGSPTKGLVGLLAFILFYYLLVNNITVGRLKLFFWGLVASTGLITAYSLLQLAGVYVLPLAFTKTASFNPLGSLSGLTSYLVVTLPLLIIAASQVDEIHPGLNKFSGAVLKFVLGLLILGTLVILTLLSGFTFWPVALVGAVIVLMFLLAKIIKISSGNLVIPVVVFLLLIVQLVLGNFNFVKLDLPTEVSLSRTASWQIAKNSLMKDPILGSGPSTFYYSFTKFKSPDFNGTPLWNVRFDNASGALFEFAASTGALGLIGVIIIVLIAISTSFISLTKSDKKEPRLVLLGLFSSFVVAMLIAALLPLSSPLILIFVALSALTVAVTTAIYPEKFKALNLSFRASAKFALALSAIFLSVSAGVVVLFTMGFKMFVADIYAQSSLNQSDASAKIDKLTKATQLAPYQDKYYIELANNYLALANREAAGSADPTAIGNYLNLAIDSGKKAVELSPNNAADNESLALVYENASFYVRGALEWAETLYKKDAELDPQNPTPFLRIALINVARANLTQDQKEKEQYLNEAIKQYDAAIAKKSDLASAYYGQAIAYEKMNKLDQSIDQLKKAVVIDSSSIDYRFELGRLFFNRGVAKPDLSQRASADIVTGEGEPGLSTAADQPSGGTASLNDDLKTAEQLFQSILAANPNHANALYSLALLYQKTGNSSDARKMVAQLLNILPEDATKEAVRKQFTGLY